MLYPSVDSLKTQIDSKYSLVSVASKRARQLQEEGGERLTSYVSHKQVGRALEEVAAGELTIQSSSDSVVYEDEV
ncbi:DNA-directed RNA polymerase subunit omega [Psychrobacillus psychrodurans]|jgi:DNA-directed RNA polymerase subunit omega|uniref:DNA-directed RNA polymerase subunit omega n=1 Tax=Psychrobacillus psychrodurans TaxID=126157 RepID=A0A9X3LA45_9BACI|nr:DNA-directed RNA polymerase subunit omega [Psychrobacillus psychrodurans]MCK1996216.1 DNA-directed RNA polymerase subunit omega [Psychrobacillus psychrodurans]MCZ8532836.1 DNA-directed RNA polymerase subunit omega [Psychrobacillus psychrodurans]MCZ8539482.1 DNA-directed RNA polymerase subunit omega [Psychrobacillus psychrodurans]SFM39900.1 DNA-directed RNA polymerase subunit omega [Psychrobacillus psychrodurans]